MSLSGKRALVSGGSRGIGAAIARTLAAAGADVAITFEKSAGLAAEVVRDIEAAGRRAIAIQADNANVDAVQKSVATTVARFGGLDILVNNAGILRLATLKDMSLEDINALLDINIRGPIVASKAAIPHLGKGGRVITIGSFFANNVPLPMLGVYAATKTALIGLTKGLARELGPIEATANLVQPGSIDTDMNPAEGPFKEATLSGVAIRRYGRGGDIASTVAFLASADAQYITGATLTVDGGFTS